MCGPRIPNNIYMLVVLLSVQREQIPCSRNCRGQAREQGQWVIACSTLVRSIYRRIVGRLINRNTYERIKLTIIIESECQHEERERKPRNSFLRQNPTRNLFLNTNKTTDDSSWSYREELQGNRDEGMRIISPPSKTEQLNEGGYTNAAKHPTEVEGFHADASEGGISHVNIPPSTTTINTTTLQQILGNRREFLLCILA